MAANILGKGKIVLEYLEKYKEFSKNAVATKIQADYPLVFSSKEDARVLVRYYTGSMGESKRNQIDKSKLRKNYCIPKSKAVVTKDYILPQIHNNILWLSDIHIPNHHEEAIQLAVQYGVENKVNTIILGGDLIDNFPFTKHDKKPDRGEAKKMFEDVIQFLIMLRDTFQEAKIIWIEGNHDRWYQNWLRKNAPVVWDDEYYQLEQRLKLTDFDIEYLQEKQILKIDGLHCLHGHTLNKGAFNPVNPARGIFMRGKSSAIIGHCHQSSKHTESNLKGQIISCFSTGALCHLRPDYDPHNTKHNLGFAHITRSNGNFHVRNLEIYNNQIL